MPSYTLSGAGSAPACLQEAVRKTRTKWTHPALVFQLPINKQRPAPHTPGSYLREQAEQKTTSPLAPFRQQAGASAFPVHPPAPLPTALQTSLQSTGAPQGRLLRTNCKQLHRHLHRAAQPCSTPCAASPPDTQSRRPLLAGPNCKHRQQKSWHQPYSGRHCCVHSKAQCAVWLETQPAALPLPALKPCGRGRPAQSQVRPRVQTLGRLRQPPGTRSGPTPLHWFWGQPGPTLLRQPCRLVASAASRAPRCLRPPKLPSLPLLASPATRRPVPCSSSKTARRHS